MAQPDQTENMLGALATLLSDRIRQATAEVAGGSGELASSIVSLTSMLDEPSNEELRSALGLTHSATVRLVHRLVARKLAVKSSGPDLRSIAIMATTEAHDLAQRILDARRRIVRDSLSSLTRTEQRQLNTLLAKILEGESSSSGGAMRVCRLCDVTACGFAAGRCPV